MATGFDNNEFLMSDSNCQTINVKVTDYGYGNINPSPIKLPKDTELLEEFLSPRKLQALTGVDNLETVEYLEMRVNTDQMSLGNFGMYLPNLTQIKLSGSYIPTIRDLGTSLWNLQVLWMPQCNLHCLDGLVTMSNIKELYLAYNEIEDISSCGMLECLEILDLEGNLIQDTSSIHYLSMCPNLSRITLESNPLYNVSNYQLPMTYRKFVYQLVPQIQYLDDLPIGIESQHLADGDGKDKSNNLEFANHSTLEFEDHWNFINSMLLESGLLAESSRSKESMSPLTADDSGRPSSSYSLSTRPSSAMVSLTSQRRSLTSSIGRPMSSNGQRPASATSIDSSNDIDDKPDDSNMTAGRIVCGNIAKSLRRHSDMDKVMSAKAPLKTRPNTSFVSPDKFNNMDDNDDVSCEQVLAELQNWRHDYNKSRARIEQHKAPQVLTIECDEDDIEQVDMTNNYMKQYQLSTNQIIVNQPIKPSQHIMKSTNQNRKSAHHNIKPSHNLNPIKNAPIHDQVPNTTDINKNDKSITNTKIANQINLLQSQPIESTNHSSLNNYQHKSPPQSATTSIPPIQQMSRIRRQLLQSGVSTITPSKPLLKR